MALFLVQHIGAALWTRATGQPTDTDWAAAVVNQMPHLFYFAPYYTLGIASIFAHLAARYRSLPLLIAGSIFSVTVVTGFMIAL